MKLSINSFLTNNKKGKSDNRTPSSLWWSFVFLLGGLLTVGYLTLNSLNDLKNLDYLSVTVNDINGKIQTLGYQVNRGVLGDAGAIAGIAQTRSKIDSELNQISSSGFDTSKVKSDLNILDTIISPLLSNKKQLSDRLDAAKEIVDYLNEIKRTNVGLWNKLNFTNNLLFQGTIVGFHDAEINYINKNWVGVNLTLDNQIDILTKTQNLINNISSISNVLAPFGEASAMSKVTSDVDNLSSQILSYDFKTKWYFAIFALLIIMIFSAIFSYRAVSFSTDETSRIRKESKSLRIIYSNAGSLLGKANTIIDDNGVVLNTSLHYDRLGLTGSIFQLGSILQRILSSTVKMIKHTETAMSDVDENALLTNQSSLKIQQSLNSIEEQSSIAKESGEKIFVAQAEENNLLVETHKEIGLLIRNVEVLDDLVMKILYRMDNVRDMSQGISKRIKQFAESSHAMNDNTSIQKDVAKQIKVLSINAAVLSADFGEDGQRLIRIQQEIQRLASLSIQNSERMDNLVVALRDDSQSSVNEMEEGTQLIVDTSNQTVKNSEEVKKVMDILKNISLLIDKISERNIIIHDNNNLNNSANKKIINDIRISDDNISLLFNGLSNIKDLSKQLIRVLHERFPSHN